MVKTAAWRIARAEVPKISGDFSTGEHTHTDIYIYVYIWMYIYVGNRWRSWRWWWWWCCRWWPITIFWGAAVLGKAVSMKDERWGEATQLSTVWNWCFNIWRLCWDDSSTTDCKVGGLRKTRGRNHWLPAARSSSASRRWKNSFRRLAGGRSVAMMATWNGWRSNANYLRIPEVQHCGTLRAAAAPLDRQISRLMHLKEIWDTWWHVEIWKALAKRVVWSTATKMNKGGSEVATRQDPCIFPVGTKGVGGQCDVKRTGVHRSVLPIIWQFFPSNPPTWYVISCRDPPKCM